ncbi:MAG TPA: hypothetical protein DEP23_02310 [Ruminococcaceae bacterium]|nr:hypothetical protein [Oscillospiraceae bacterium]
MTLHSYIVQFYRNVRGQRQNFGIQIYSDSPADAIKQASYNLQLCHSSKATWKAEAYLEKEGK